MSIRDLAERKRARRRARNRALWGNRSGFVFRGQFREPAVRSPWKRSR